MKVSQDKISLITTRDHEKNTLNISIVDEDKVSEVKIKPDKINMLDKIHFHKKTSDIIYVDMLQSTFEISKMETKVPKLEGKFKKEKAANKAWHAQIKRLDTYILVVGVDPKNMQAIKKILDEKENTIQVLKKKLKILGVEHVQTPKLTSLEKERDSLQQEVIRYKEKVSTLENQNKNGRSINRSYC